VLLLYDGDCRFCRWSVAWVHDRDSRGVLKPVPILSRTGAELLSDLAPADRLKSIHVIRGDGTRLSGGEAVPVVLDALPGWQRLAGLTRVSPTATDAAYRFVARHRDSFSRLLFSSSKRAADAKLRELIQKDPTLQPPIV
jgi:predicted DCC family thiol-disulfide oxidoreductase YuxK